MYLEKIAGGFIFISYSDRALGQIHFGSPHTIIFAFLRERLFLGLKRRGGLITNITPTDPDSALWLLFHCMICMNLLENRESFRNC